MRKKIELADLPPKIRRQIVQREHDYRLLKSLRDDKSPDDGYRLEKDFIRDALSLLADLRIFAWRNNSGSGRPGRRGNRYIKFGLTGSCDIIGVLPGGKFLGIECKSLKGRPKPAQIEFVRRVKEAGGVVGFAWNLVDIQRLIKGQSNG